MRVSDGAQPGYRLVRRPAASVGAPDLDPAQRAVVEHPGGPLLVLAGPGTGKTTTIVETVVARIEAGTDPERVLVLTFGRKAARELRERITARLGRTVREPLARTFHSYCFGVLRREAALRGEPAPRLLSSPEQDLVVRELLRGELAGDGRPSGWPEGLRAALPTRGFAQELRDLLMRCVERGVGPQDLDRLGRRHQRADWRAAARFSRQYAEVTALAERAAYDPSELVRAVLERFADPKEQLLERERAAYDLVLVDEYQDTDPAQEELLHALVRPGGDLVVVGDPDQAIYGFRGAEVQGVRRFPEAFPTTQGDAAPVVELQTCRRSAPEVLAAGVAVAARMRGPRRVRALHPIPGREAGRVDVLVAASLSQEAALVAGVLRRAHVVEGIPWSQMAVLVRSTRERLAVLQRALLAAGVPVDVAGGELPLRDQPGLWPLLEVLRVGLSPEELDEETAVALLSSPLGGLDALGLRRLRRELRHLELAAGGDLLAAELLVRAVRDPRDALLLEDRVARPVERVAALVALAGSAAARESSTAESVLWELWRASGLGSRWQAASRAGGARGAAADRDLDAMMALFDAAARFVDRLPAAGPGVFLDHLGGQEIPGETLAAQAPETDTVRVLTAHAAKGLEWELVVVAGVGESVWPDLRARGSLLGSELLVELLALGEEVPGSAVPRVLEEERRLFYVALTRARERLVVTAVSDPDQDEQPSRFLADVPLPRDDQVPVQEMGADGRAGRDARTTLGALRRTLPVGALGPALHGIARDPAQPAATRVRARALAGEVAEVSRSLDLGSLVAELRSAAADTAAPPGLRRAAAHELARCAAASVPAADPEQWWGLLELSDTRPLRSPGQQVRVSPSRVEAFTTCELRWLLESFGGRAPDSASQSVGNLVHDLAALAAADPELLAPGRLAAELEQRWNEVDLGSPWFTERERLRAGGMLERLAGWLALNTRELLAAEHAFAVDFPAGELTVRLAGRVDRIERDGDGRAVVVDLKTGTGKPRKEELAEHPQLGAYQAAVELGAFGDLGVEQSGGASLVQLGKAAGTGDAKEQRQAALDQAEDPTWARRLVTSVAVGMAGAVFQARENQHCDRCPVRTSCPVHEQGREVVGE